MQQATLEFDGVRYLDGRASDPRHLAWMRGTPPPPDRLIRFEDDRFLEFPQIRWSLSHMRELLPTVNVWRGDGPPSAFGKAAGMDEETIDQLAFTDLLGRERRFGESLYDTYTDGILVLYRGRCIYERYFGALKPQVPHSCFSITKSYAALLCAALVHDGTLDAGQRIPHWLPEMKDTAYADATLRQVMDMQVGVAYTEQYSDPGPHMLGLRARRWPCGPRKGGLAAAPAAVAGTCGPLQARGAHRQILRELAADGQHRSDGAARLQRIHLHRSNRW